MKEQLLLLLELQRIDVRIKELRKEIEALPARLATDKRDLARLDGILQAERDRLADSERWRREQEELIQLEDEAIRKAKIKLQAAKNSKDYTAASRELDNKRKAKSEREEEVLKVLEALERGRAGVAGHEKDIATLGGQVQAEEEKVRAVIAELEAEVSERATGREELLARLKPDLLARYDYVMKRRGSAIAAVVDGICQGCHMSIPPQLNNLLARHGSIEACPRCARLLYRQEIMDETPAES